MSSSSRKRSASSSTDNVPGPERLPKKQRGPETCGWIDHEPSYRAWKAWDESVASTLWIHGPAGIGKSFLARAILDDLAQTEEGPVLSCFCDATSTTSSILRTLLSQLAGSPSVEPDVRGSITKATVEPVPAQEQSPFDVSYKLYDCLRSIVGQAPPLTIVVDGLDELPDEYLHSAEFNLTTQLVDLTSIMAGRARVLVLSRTNAHIRHSLADSPQIQITAEKVRGDITKFAHAQVAAHPVLLPVKDQVVAQLVDDADGIFLWVSFSTQALARETSQEGVLARLREIPPSLDELYARIMGRQTGQLSRQQRSLRDTILRWTVFAVRPFRTLELANAISVETGAFVSDVEKTALQACDSLIRFDGAGIKPVHQSLRDFLVGGGSTQDRGQTEGSGRVDAAAANLAIARTLLTYLSHPRLEEGTGEDGFEESYPLAEYATLYWVQHVSNSSADPALQEQIRSFFQTSRADTWLERLLPRFLSRSVLSIPPRPPINARFFYLTMLKSQLVNYFPPDQRQEFGLQFDARLLGTHERLLEEARTQDPHGLLTLQRLIELGELNTWLPGRKKEAETLVAEAVRLSSGFASPEARNLRVAAHLSLADAVKRDGRYDEAEKLLEDILAWAAAPPSPSASADADTSYMVFVYDMLGWVAMRRSQLDQSATYLQKAVDLALEAFGSQSPFVLRSRVTLAEVLGKLGRHVEAEALCAQLEKQVREHRSNGAPLPRDSVSQLPSLAAIYAQRGKYGQARDVHAMVVTNRTTVFGADHRLTLWAEMQLGLTMRKAGDEDGARRVLGALLPRQKGVLGPEHQDVKDVACALQEMDGLVG